MINLLPTDVKQQRIYGRRNSLLREYSIALVGTAAITALIMAGSLQFVGQDEPRLQEEITAATVDIQALEGDIREIESVASRLDTAKKISELSIQFSDLLPKIGAVLPGGTVLNALSLTEGVTGSLILDVDLTSADLAPVLSRNLVESELFNAADIISLTPKSTSDGSAQAAYTFSASLTASFADPQDAERATAAQVIEQPKTDTNIRQEGDGQ